MRESANLRSPISASPDFKYLRRETIALRASVRSLSSLRLNGRDRKTTARSVVRMNGLLTFDKYFRENRVVTSRISVPCIVRHHDSWSIQPFSSTCLQFVIACPKSSPTSWASTLGENGSISPLSCFRPPACLRLA